MASGSTQGTYNNWSVCVETQHVGFGTDTIERASECRFSKLDPPQSLDPETDAKGRAARKVLFINLKIQ